MQCFHPKALVGQVPAEPGCPILVRTKMIACSGSSAFSTSARRSSFLRGSTEAAGAKKLLLTHRPRELALSDSLELAHDGLEVEV